MGLAPHKPFSRCYLLRAPNRRMSDFLLLGPPGNYISYFVPMEVPTTTNTTGKFVVYAARDTASYNANGTDGNYLIIMNEQYAFLFPSSACAMHWVL